MKQILTIALSILVVSTACAQQGGSFFLKDIKTLLEQQGELWNSIQTGFDIYPTGDAPRIGWAENKELAGSRIGPYHLWAKPKHSPGPFVFEISVETEISFIDKFNKVVKFEQATDVREKVVAIKIRPLPPDEYFESPAR